MYMHIWDQKSQHASYFSSYVNDLFDLYVQSITKEREREGERENEGEIVKEGRERFCNIQCLLKRSIFNDCRM